MRDFFFFIEKTSKWPEAKLVWAYNPNTHTNKNNTKKENKIKKKRKEKEKKKEKKRRINK